MPVKQTQEENIRLRKALGKKKIEFDELKKLLDTTKAQLEEIVKSKDMEMDKVKENHRVEIDEYKLKLQKSKKFLMDTLKEQELNYGKQLELVQEKNNEDITKLRNHFERRIKELETKFEMEKEELLQERRQHGEREVRYVKIKRHIQNLIESREKTLSDQKNYYEEIIQNHMGHISRLEDQQMDTLSLEKTLESVLKKNESLTTQLERTNKVISELEECLSINKVRMTKVKAHLQMSEKKMKNLKCENSELVLRLSKVEREREKLHQQLSSSILEGPQKCNIRYLHKIDAFKRPNLIKLPSII